MHKIMRFGRAAQAAAISLTMVAGVAPASAQSTLPPSLRGPELTGPESPQLERGRQVYVLSGCHFCHGKDLASARGGAADLGTSRLLGADDNGNMIGAIVRAGVPRTQTAMPQYSDLTDAQIADLAAYMHFLRQRLSFNAAARPSTTAADAEAGAIYFQSRCASCHQTDIGRKDDAAALRLKILRPAPTAPTAAALAPGRKAHLKLLENYTPAEVGNLVAYLRNPGAVKVAARAGGVVDARLEASCFTCHGPAGAGNARAPALVNSAHLAGLSDAQIKAVIQAGSAAGMPAFKFDEKTLTEVAAWLRAKNPATK